MASWGDVFRPTSTRLLEALLQGPRTLSQLADETGLAKPSLLRQLRVLTDRGLVTGRVDATSRGRQSTYALAAASVHLELRPEAGAAIAWASGGPVDHDFPLASQIQDWESRTEVLGVLRALEVQLDAVERWDDCFVILFGSAARGELTWKSDLDLLFVVSEEEAATVRTAVEDTFSIIQDKLEHAARAHHTTRDAFVRQQRKIDREAARDGLVLHDPWGEADLWRPMKRYKRISI